ncbi:hypothetical protein BV898_14741 [Hypsibius exemplaris]|uniref:Ubiquitin-like domain-containing protein n=1 Tax=Hypsibius exemplaris TaxID=2072580 RepID=A0A9X6NGG5_HYPEX|nr:hypothetical protein BV898_14741 [Hypsibius exemplaris]
MRIRIEPIMAGSDPFHLEVNPEDTIRDVKRMIVAQHLPDIRVEQFDLNYRHKLLKPSETLILSRHRRGRSNPSSHYPTAAHRRDLRRLKSPVKEALN